MEGELYAQEGRDAPGVHTFSLQKMLDENADYVVFNGAVGALTGDNALAANVGDKVRMYFGAGGPNLASSRLLKKGSPERLCPSGGGLGVSPRFKSPVLGWGKKGGQQFFSTLLAGTSLARPLMKCM